MQTTDTFATTRNALVAAAVRADLAAGRSSLISTRHTADGVAIELHETGDEREPLRLGTRRESSLTRRRAPLPAAAVLALWGEITMLTEAEVRAADKRLVGADDFRAAISPRSGRGPRTAREVARAEERCAIESHRRTEEIRAHMAVCRSFRCRTCGGR